jgi:hypothetical protein
VHRLLAATEIWIEHEQALPHSIQQEESGSPVLLDSRPGPLPSKVYLVLICHNSMPPHWSCGITAQDYAPNSALGRRKQCRSRNFSLEASSSCLSLGGLRAAHALLVPTETGPLYFVYLPQEETHLLSATLASQSGTALLF